VGVRCTFLLCGTVRNEKIVILKSYIIHGILLFEDIVSEFTSSYCSSSTPPPRYLYPAG